MIIHLAHPFTFDTAYANHIVSNSLCTTQTSPKSTAYLTLKFRNQDRITICV